PRGPVAITLAMLSLQHISKSYWRGRHEIVVLDDVSFDVDAGEFAAIFGQRASGKTTLLRIAAGMERPDTGAVHFAGEDMSTLSRPALLTGLHQQIGWVRRPGPSTLTMRMLDYVALPLLRDMRHAEAHRRATSALKRVHAAELARAKWHHLSDAERTLVMIAQAIVRTPALLLADDPTMGLDFTEREIVAELLRETAQANGMAVLMTVPELPDSMSSHRVMSLSGGELIEAKRRAPGEVIELRRERGSSA
ncbi:MAG TPA: ATP-binding cassette domain-containing protein, partial [Thermoleophilaceae bacterium]